MNINLEYYKIFYYVAKLGGITLAAEELSISQPAVSQAIKHLEEAVKISVCANRQRSPPDSSRRNALCVCEERV